MSSTYVISSIPFDNYIESKTPENKFIDLCGCVFCWTYRFTRNCAKCEKMFCSEHIEIHLCFREKPTSTSSAIVGAVDYTAIMESALK